MNEKTQWEKRARGLGKYKEIDVPKLCESIARSRLALRPFRQNRVDMVRQYVGQHYSEEGTSESVPVNLMAQFVEIYSRQLVPKAPRALLSTFNRGIKPTVEAMQIWANKEIEHMRLQETIQRVVTDAFFSVGILKVALAAPADSAVYAWQLKAGQPFAVRVDLDDFVFDVHARAFEEVSYIGHRFRVPLDVVKDSKLYSRYRKHLEPSRDSPYNLEGDERVSVIGRSYYAVDAEEWEAMVDLWEIYLPRHRVLLTLCDEDLQGPGTDEKAEPLRQQGWLGPECGPYHMLGYLMVPGQAMPKGPLQDLYDLHMAANKGFRKLIRAMERTKEITIVRGGADEDGNRIIKANDGDMVKGDDPQSTLQVVFGSKHAQAILGTATILRQLFNDMGGNLALLGGQAPQSKTAAQDELLNANAGQGMADKAAKTTDFVSRTVRALCWYWWHDPFNVQKSKHNLPGMPEMDIVRQVTPEMRKQGKFEDLEIKVDPYSMQYQTPQQRMAALDQVITQVFVPLAAQMAQSGIQADWNAYLALKSQFLEIPELADILTIREPPQTEDAGGGGDRVSGPASTTREYVRHSMPGRTQRGNDMNMVNKLMGVNGGGAPETNGAAQ